MLDNSNQSEGRSRRVGRSKKVVALVVIALLVLTIGYFNRGAIRGALDEFASQEFSGGGTSSTSFTIAKGDSGSTVAKHLVEQGITKDYGSTLRHIVSASPTFFPGTYTLPLEISTDKAIELLTDPGNQLVNKVTIPEGLRLVDIFKRLSSSTGISIQKFEAASESLIGYKLPKAAPSLEGYLFPATYRFDPSLNATQVLTIMVNRMKEELNSYGVAKKDWQKTLTLASIVQREARLHDDFYKVSRVFKNRLEINMPLQSCATASYGVGSFSIIVTNKILNDDNPYNTYKYVGLPLGPISAPGSLAIDAVLHPAEGSWLYFVTWNLSSGETIFSNTFAEHQAGITKWDNWMAQNPGWDD